MKEVFELLSKGGIVMIPIALGSVVALAIFIERMWNLRYRKIIPVGLVETVVKLVRKGSVDKAMEKCIESNSPMGSVLLAAVEAEDKSRSELKELMEDVGKHEIARMDRFIEAMGTVASVEPLLGLLGTVTGMIQVFQKVVVSSSAGFVNPGELANGIWQALMTTAAGLSVAIVAFVGYRYLSSCSTRRALEMEEGALALLEILVPSSGNKADVEKSSGKKA